MEKLTKQEAIQKHRDMWNWIAEQIEEEEKVQDIDKLKIRYCKKNRIHISLNCFLCEFYEKNRENEEFCEEKCILSWKNNKCISSEYEDCCKAETWKEQHELALKIANLEERKFEDESV